MEIVSESYYVAMVKMIKKAGLLLANDSTGNLLLGISSTCKAIEIARGKASCYFNHVTHAINPK